MPESVNELDAVKIVERTLPYLAHHDVRFGAPETDDPVYPAVELCDPASGAARKMIEAHCEMRGLPFCKEGASLIFQRYCHRLCGLASASALLTGSVPLLTSGNVSMSLANGTPKTMWLAENKTIDKPNPPRCCFLQLLTLFEPYPAFHVRLQKRPFGLVNAVLLRHPRSGVSLAFFESANEFD